VSAEKFPGEGQRKKKTEK